MSANYFPVRAVAATIRQSPDTVLRLIRAGRLRATNAGLSDKRPRWIVAESDLEDFLRQRQNLPSETPKAKRVRVKKSKIPNYFSSNN